MMSQLMLVLGVAPILAPSLGGAVLAFASWRWIFWILAGYALICCALVYALMPETLPPERRLALHPAQQLARYIAILRERVFLTHAAMGCCASFAFFSYLGGSSPVFIRGFRLVAAAVRPGLRSVLDRADRQHSDQRPPSAALWAVTHIAGGRPHRIFAPR
jgi:DHA1 family bicyclomycin/chloramphenicol resistance-like MFS transporter